MATRSKRWNGKFDSLPTEYLKGVMAKMQDYGDHVQFSLVAGGPEPSYQVVNTSGRTIAFDRNHHLFRPEGEEFVGVNATPVFSLEQVKAAVAGLRMTSGSGSASKTSRVVRTGTTTRTTAARIEEQFATQRYEYFKNNRQMLPAAITQHTEEITELMKKGKSVEDAFGEVLKKYF